MKFLTLHDIHITIEECNLHEITNCKSYIVDEAEERALETIREYLRGRYDIDFELRAYATSGTTLDYLERFKDSDDSIYVNGTSGLLSDDRNFSLKTIALDLMKYELFQRVAPRQLSTIVQDRYDRAIEKLTNINKGLLTMNLKSITDATDQTYMPFRYGNNEWSNKYKW
jgi:hypothetical protein